MRHEQTASQSGGPHEPSRRAHSVEAFDDQREAAYARCEIAKQLRLDYLHSPTLEIA